MHRHLVFWLLLVSVATLEQVVWAQQEPERKTLIVATKEIPPFVIKGERNTWSGVSFDLWRSIAEKLELKFEFRERWFVDRSRDGYQTLTALSNSCPLCSRCWCDFRGL